MDSLQYEYYSWEEFDRDTDAIIQSLYHLRHTFDGIWGPPRGGLPLAVVLSHALDIPLLLAPASERTLVVDDIADTGKTLEPCAKKNMIVTLFYHRQSVVIPHIWMREKTDKFIVFPWEKKYAP